MGKGYLATAIVVSVMLVLAGCAFGSHKLPGNWPIPELTMPADIEITSKPRYLHSTGEGLAKGISMDLWSVCFKYEPGIPAFVGHIEKCLKPLGYYKACTIDQNGNYYLGKVHYWSPDHKTHIELDLVNINPNDTNADHTLTVSVSPEARRVPEHAEYKSDAGTSYFKPIE